MKSTNLEYLDNEIVMQYQKNLFKSLLQYLMIHSPYYKNYLIKNGVENVSSFDIENIDKLPITKKQELAEDNQKFFCVDLSKAADIISTSGTTSKTPLLHPLTSSDLSRLAYNEKVSLEKTNIKSDDLLMLTTALDGSFIAGLAYYLGLKDLGVSIIRTGSRLPDLQANILSEHPVNVILGVPSNLIKLYDYCKAGSNKLSVNRISKLILIGEAIRNEKYQLNQLGLRLQSCFPYAKLYSTYANTETCSSFCECDSGRGGHLNPELAYAEIVDEEGNVLPDLKIGHLVITTFGAQGMPLLRYDTGDITFIDHSRCSCGRTSPRIGPILGRKEGICKINGVSFQISAVGDVILGISEIKDYYVIVKKNENGVSNLQVYYYTERDDIASINVRLKFNIWERFRVAATVNYCTKENLLELQYSSGSRKPVRYRND